MKNETAVKPAHTPTPLLVECIKNSRNFFQNDKDFLVCAVNAHEELVTMLYKAIAEIAEWHADSSNEEPCKLLVELEKTLAKAEGRE